MKKFWRVAWIILRTLILAGLAYPFAEGMLKLEAARTGIRDSWNGIFFLGGWVLFVPAFSFLLPAIIKKFKLHKRVAAILFLLLTVILSVPLAAGLIVSAMAPGLNSAYLQLDLPDGQSVKLPVRCDLSGYPDSYAIIAYNTTENDDPARTNFAIKKNIYDVGFDFPIVEVYFGEPNYWAFYHEHNGTDLVRTTDGRTGTFSGVTVMYRGPESRWTYTDGNDFYKEGESYEFSGSWVCRP
jgi:hypothetical protein